ncbi:MAG: biotin/lipoyl-containing protein [Planctomycetota bacterium]
MSEPTAPRPEPAHGPEGEHGGLADLSSLSPAAPNPSSHPSRRKTDRRAADTVAGGEMRFRVTVDGVAYDVAVEPLDAVAGAVDDPGVAPPTHDDPIVQPAPPPSSHPVPSAPQPPGDHPLTCPVAGVVVKVLVKAGDAVAEDQPVAIVEALKVESRVLAPHDGTVSAVLVSAGDRVRAGDVLLRL